MPSGYVPEVTQAWVDQPQWVEEVTLGTTPTASPTFSQIGHITTWNVTHDTTSTKFRVVGNEDLVSSVKNGESYAIQLEYSLFNSEFLKWGANSRGAGSGSIDVSRSILWSHPIDGTKMYDIAKMCRVNSGSININPETVTVAMTIIASVVSPPNASHGLTTPTLITPSTTDPCVGLSGGANPFTHNSLNYDVTNFRMDFARSLALTRVNGQAQIIDNPSTTRDITGVFDVVRKDSVLRADALSHVKRTAAYTVRAASPISLSFTDMQLFSVAESASAGQTSLVVDSFGYSATKVSVT